MHNYVTFMKSNYFPKQQMSLERSTDMHICKSLSCQS